MISSRGTIIRSLMVILSTCSAAGIPEFDGGRCSDCLVNEERKFENGQITSVTHDDGSVFIFQYSCFSGYLLIGSPKVKCISAVVRVCDRPYNNTPSCNPVDCRTAKTEKIGGLSFENSTYSNVDPYICRVEYLNGLRHFISSSSSVVWEVQNFSGILGYSDHSNPGGFVIVNVINETDFHLLTYSCLVGYNIQGSRVSTYSDSTFWRPRTPLCFIVDCRLPLVPGRVLARFNSTTYESVVAYNCPLGYILDGSEEAVCTSSGVWTAPPTCTNDPTYLYLVTIPVLSGFCLVFSINCICCCMVYCNKRKRLPKATPMHETESDDKEEVGNEKTKHGNKEEEETQKGTKPKRKPKFISGTSVASGQYRTGDGPKPKLIVSGKRRRVNIRGSRRKLYASPVGPRDTGIAAADLRKLFDVLKSHETYTNKDPVKQEVPSRKAVAKPKSIKPDVEGKDPSPVRVPSSRVIVRSQRHRYRRVGTRKPRHVYGPRKFTVPPPQRMSVSAAPRVGFDLFSEDSLSI